MSVYPGEIIISQYPEETSIGIQLPVSFTVRNNGAYFPTFGCGWFDYDYVNIQNSSAAVVPGNGFSFSCNPVHGSVTISTAGRASRELRVYDISGREVSSVSITNGTGIWNGIDYSGFVQRITLLGR